MTFSPEQYQASIGENEPIPTRMRAYYKQRFQQKAFAKLAQAFAERAEQFGLTKSGIASLVGRDKAQINRLFAHPTNMTLDTYSELALALNFEPTIVLEDLGEDARHNYCHPAYLDVLPANPGTGNVSTIRELQKQPQSEVRSASKNSVQSVKVLTDA